MFLGLLDLDPDPLVRGMGPAPDPDQAKIVRKILIPTVTSLRLFVFEKLCKCTFKK
jgi:hypothetical protein